MFCYTMFILYLPEYTRKFIFFVHISPPAVSFFLFYCLYKFLKNKHTSHTKGSDRWNRKTYRICLAALIIAAMISGICYYRFVCKEEASPKEGVFVYRDMMGRECV